MVLIRALNKFNTRYLVGGRVVWYYSDWPASDKIPVIRYLIVIKKKNCMHLISSDCI